MENIITETLYPIELHNIEKLHIINPSLNNDIAIVFDNFLRDGIMFNLIESIFKYAPGVKIYIADQSIYHPNTMILYNKLILKGHEVIFCGLDCGISVARNNAIKQVNEKYIFMCDCDNLFTRFTDLNILKNILEKNCNIGLVSLYEKEHNQINHYEINLERTGDLLIYNYISEHADCRNKEFFLCDYTMNMGLAKKELFDSVKYDEQMKLTEHLDFFMSIKYNTEWKVACATSVNIDNQDIILDNSSYNLFRARNKLFWKLYKTKWNLTKINNYDLETTQVTKPSIPKEYKTDSLDSTSTYMCIKFINSHSINFYLIDKCCLNFIKHKPLESTKLCIATDTLTNKNIIENYAKYLKLDIEVKIGNLKTKIVEINNTKIFVPCPVIQYLEKTFKQTWKELQNG